MPYQPTKEEIKTAIFADEYIKNGMNGTHAYKAVAPHVSDPTAGVAATRMLKRDRVRKAIQDRLPSDSVISRVIKDSIIQNPEDKLTHDIRYKYVNLALKLKGYLNDKHDSNVNIGLYVSKD